MLSLTDLVDALGPGLLRLVTAGTGVNGDPQVHDVVLAEPGEAAGQPGELVLGAGVAGPRDAVALLERAAAAGAAGVVLKAPLADDPAVVDAAGRLRPALVELQPDTSWTHVVWLARGAIDRAYAPQPGAADGGVHDDLFALADTAAEIADAPVTLEDARSRVLAYSGRQDRADPARVSTIVGRRVPAQVIAHLRACGVFRSLARSSDPVHVPAGPDGMLPRLVIPVRAGGEWLGSIWVVARTPVPPDRVRRLADLASVLALHLLRLRAEAGVARRVLADQLRGALRNGADGVPVPPPWRVAALGGGTDGDLRQRLDLWDAIARRFGWHRPLLTDVDDTLFAVLTDPPGPRRDAGSMAWLRNVLVQVRAHDRTLYAAAGGPAPSPADLPRARSEAAELAGLVASGRLPAGTVLLEDAWDAVVVERARRAAGGPVPGGPVPDLRAHDAANGTAFLSTLAAWLDHFGDTKGTADALGVHPNTLRHRLRRMSEVTELDLSSPRRRLALRLQLTALEEDPATRNE
ncbi:PucR family transcriptional regulator [Actinomadura decatromicini]|uniref:PucR family transcriptional regulator n=1 Tax=Actinomadura decatromicini TaxID=2604572 RepID=A0A5D3FX39_9ACTN|nr:PucR family transcriptional regulator [Actinomadura decatromicini]TYK52901.1 PucR family transcriptional regulator [Actinomadura decatromicini]